MVIQDMPSMSPRVPLPNATQQAEFERQFDVLINEHLSYTCIVTWVSPIHFHAVSLKTLRKSA